MIYKSHVDDINSMKLEGVVIYSSAMLLIIKGSKNLSGKSLSSSKILLNFSRKLTPSSSVSVPLKR